MRTGGAVKVNHLYANLLFCPPISSRNNRLMAAGAVCSFRDMARESRGRPGKFAESGTCYNRGGD